MFGCQVDVMYPQNISKNDLWLTLLTRLIWITLTYTWLPGHLQVRFLAYLAYTAYILLPAPLKPSPSWFRALCHLAHYHRQLLPQTRFLESFLEYVHSFRYQALRPTFTGPVFLRGSSGVLG